MKLVLKKNSCIALYKWKTKFPSVKRISLGKCDWQFIGQQVAVDDWEFSECDVEFTVNKESIVEFGFFYGITNQYLVKLPPNEYEATHFIFNWRQVDVH